MGGSEFILGFRTSFFFRKNSLLGWLSISFNFVLCSGWLKEQLQVQAQGLSGHLSLFWPDINQSSWIGGNADGGLHERTPYWLNGFVPLAYQLQDEDLLKQASRSFSYWIFLINFHLCFLFTQTHFFIWLILSFPQYTLLSKNPQEKRNLFHL